MNLNNTLKTLRTSKGLSQSDMAAILEISLSSYQKYEREKNNVTPSLDVLIRIADFFSVSLDYLLGREPLPNPFADLNISREDEEELIETYMSFPPEVRAILIDTIRKLTKLSLNTPEKAKASESNSQRITITAGELEDQWKAEQEAEKDGGKFA